MKPTTDDSDHGTTAPGEASTQGNGFHSSSQRGESSLPATVDGTGVSDTVRRGDSVAGAVTQPQAIFVKAASATVSSVTPAGLNSDAFSTAGAKNVNKEAAVETQIEQSPKYEMSIESVEKSSVPVMEAYQAGAQITSRLDVTQGPALDLSTSGKQLIPGERFEVSF